MPTQAPTDSDLGFPAKGSLKRVPFAYLVRDIARTRSTGNLYLLAGETKKVVFFVDGRPTLVRSNLATEFLGQILTDQGLITQEQCDNTLEAIRRTGKKQGELLVEMGILSEGNLRYGLEEQVRIKLFEIFGWEEGRFQFKQGGEPGAPTGMALEQPLEGLIVAAVQERWTDERARLALKAMADRYPAVTARWTGELAAELELLPEELYFVRCLDGSRTVDELLARKYDPDVPQISTLLFGLIASGVVDAGETKLARRLPPPRPNLAPANVADDTLAPKFEQLSAITEYEDTPLPNKLPGGAAVSSSRNPRIPVLPTEDEEMFRGLDVDESIVADSRVLRGGSGERNLKPLNVHAVPTPPPTPLPLDEESDFSDLRAADDETDFSDLAHTHRDRADAPAQEPAPTKADSTKSPLPQPTRPDPAKPTLPRPGLGAPTLGAPTLGAPNVGTPTLGAPPFGAPTLGAPPFGAPTLGAPPFGARPGLTPTPVVPVSAPAPTDAPEDEDDPDLGDLDEEIEMLDDEEMLDDGLDDEALGDEDGLDDGLVGSEGDVPTDDEPAPADDDDLPADEPAPADDFDEPADEHADDDGELLTDSALSDASGVMPEIVITEPSDLNAVPAAGDEYSDEGDGPPPLGEGEEDDLLGDLDDDLVLGDADDLPELDDLDLDADADLGDIDADADLGEDGLGDEDFADDAAPRSSNEDTDGGYRVDDGAQSAEALGNTRFSQGEEAMREGDYDQAVALFEDAYANGFDLPELHAHLAFARFRASGNDPSSAPHALELLDWAEQADPGLPMIHAYRGAIYVGLGRAEEAAECFDRALYLDPENELALEYTRE